jgi:hypothetical protein
MNPYFLIGSLWIRLDALNCALLCELPDGRGHVLRLYFNHDPEPVEMFDTDAAACWDYLGSLAANLSPDFQQPLLMTN